MPNDSEQDLSLGEDGPGPQDALAILQSLADARRVFMSAGKRLAAMNAGAAPARLAAAVAELRVAHRSLEMIERKAKGLSRVALDRADELALRQAVIRCTGHAPAADEMATWRRMLETEPGARAFLRRLSAAPGFMDERRVATPFPAGHYFSPVVDPEEVRDHVTRQRMLRAGDLPGLDLDLDAMAAFLTRHGTFIAQAPFSDEPDCRHRFCYLGGSYTYGDALVLRGVIAAFRPKRIIEIGSGYSTACMLDTADEIGLDELRITCVEPNPARLLSLLRDGDEERVALLDRRVQDTDLAMFGELSDGDILFIDSAHVLKTGSDVFYELFHIIPMLKPGVLVHIHDCAWPLEYSDKQIFEKNLSWNEAYAVRALLMDSTRLRILFSASLMAVERPVALAAISKRFLAAPGSALWLEVKPSHSVAANPDHQNRPAP